MILLKNKGKLLVLVCLQLLFFSCSTTQEIKKEFQQHEKEASFFKGFVLYNPKTDKEIINHHGSFYFTPASNTKLYTFYAAYKTLKDSVKSLAYIRIKDSLFIKGTADPSFLYGFNDDNVVSFLKNSKESIYLLDASIDETPYGSGWAWDDYPYYYMPEKSLFPLYGNLLTYSISNDSIVSEPSYFKPHISRLDSISVSRKTSENQFYIAKKYTDTLSVPFITSNSLTAQLLENLLHKKVTLVPNTSRKNFEYIYSSKYDDLYKQLLVDSDNFIAEQLMLQVGKELTNSYNVNTAIKAVLAQYLQDLPQTPRWVDASGLSRYNLFSPNDMVLLLTKMYRDIPLEKLLSYLPAGGVSGTLKNWYGNEKPYVFAKSGTLSNNYNLSGYLITKKGTLLIFSYMNNHYMKSTTEIRTEMQRTLKKVYKSY